MNTSTALTETAQRQPPSHPSEITAIRGITDRIQLPRSGFLRLGEPMEGRQYPKALDHFRPDIESPSLAEAFRERYGDKPKEVPFVFPHPQFGVVAAQAYRYYRGSKVAPTEGKRRGILACKGEGRTGWATRRTDDGTWETIECPGAEECAYCRSDTNSQPKCVRSMFMLILPYELPTWTVLQVNTTSRHSMNNVNAALVTLQRTRGQIDFIRCVLRLVPQQVMFPDKNGVFKATNAHVLQIDIGEPLTEFVKAPPLIGGYEVQVAPPDDDECPADDLYGPQYMNDEETQETAETDPVNPKGANSAPSAPPSPRNPGRSGDSKEWFF